MPFEFQNLDASTRQYMLKELERDVDAGEVYLSKRLTEEGRVLYPTLLRVAIETFDATWLAHQLRDYLRSIESRQLKSGEKSPARVPYVADEMLAENEFNRYYIRGLCARAINEGIDQVEVYRGKEVAQPHPQSQAKIGQLISAQDLLDDLRHTIGTDTKLGIPSGPMSGLTVRLPTKTHAQ
jgi:hypothetical protein